MTFANVTSLLALCVALGAGSYAVGAIPGRDGKITACYEKGTGKLRVVNADRNVRCARRERRLAWNQVGPQGPPGERGERGAPGLSDLVAMVARTRHDSSSNKLLLPPDCPDGRVPISAYPRLEGITWTGTYPDERTLVVVTEMNRGGPTPIGESAASAASYRATEVAPGTSESWSLEVEILCARVP